MSLAILNPNSLISPHPLELATVGVGGLEGRTVLVQKPKCVPSLLFGRPCVYLPDLARIVPACDDTPKPGEPFYPSMAWTGVLVSIGGIRGPEGRTYGRRIILLGQRGELLAM